MFGLFYNPFQRQQSTAAAPPPAPRNPVGAEYNVPFQDIAPGQNQVNIQGGAGGANPGEAYDAFRRLYMPYIQNQANMITGMNARPIDAQGAPIPGAPQQYGPQDFEQSAQGMFQQFEDRDLLNQYFRRLGRGGPFGMR